eukprot:488301-Prorocentrum_minimum.AAC.1
MGRYNRPINSCKTCLLLLLLLLGGWVGDALGGDLVGDAAGAQRAQGELHVGASGGHVLGASAHTSAPRLDCLPQHLPVIQLYSYTVTMFLGRRRTPPPRALTTSPSTCQ